MFEMFFIRCKKNNTLVAIDSRNQRTAVTEMHHAKRFGTIGAAYDFMDEVARKEGYYFKDDHEVVQGSDYHEEPVDMSAWPHVDLVKFNILARKLGITNTTRFRGKMGHLTSLLHNGDLEEVERIVEGLKKDGKESHYPSTNPRYSGLEDEASI